MTVLSFLLSLTMVSQLQAIEFEPTKAVISPDDPADTPDAYELHYLEREPGVDDIEVTMLVSGRYVRVDEAGDDSGYIVYDDEQRVIYSVSHFDRTILVIEEHLFDDGQLPAKPGVEYLQLSDAPQVSGNSVFNYRTFSDEGGSEVTCMDVQLVENLLPEVRQLLKNYQRVISGQQVKMTDNKLNDIQTACYYIDQVYNDGAYYDKGLPIQEWHSNERSKILTSFKKVSAPDDSFKVPDDYRRYSIDRDSKIQIHRPD